jgi:hypothetical protein
MGFGTQSAMIRSRWVNLGEVLWGNGLLRPDGGPGQMISIRLCCAEGEFRIAELNFEKGMGNNPFGRMV